MDHGYILIYERASIPPGKPALGSLHQRPLQSDQEDQDDLQHPPGLLHDDEPELEDRLC